MSEAQAAPQKTISSGLVKPKRALISVSDKQGIDEFAKTLVNDYGIEIISTGGTAKFLSEAGIDVKEVSSETDFPEIMDGRVKTLHPNIHGALLGKRDNESHKSQMIEHGISPIDIVIINLYPFVETTKQNAEYDDCIENIDIGGPAMIRSAAKNHAFVSILTSSSDYSVFLDELKKNQGQTSLTFRKQLAENAYARTASYDAAIADWFAQQNDDHFPPRVSIYGRLKQKLRYGENPHQEAAVYQDDSLRPGVITATQIQGKELSYNNINDADAAFELVSEFEKPTVVIVKHANPCGVATGDDGVEAYKKALACDPTSAFGGIIALNHRLTAQMAHRVTERFYELVIAPSVEADALPILAEKKNLRILTTGEMLDPSHPRKSVRSISGGFLLQDADNGIVAQAELDVVTDRVPTERELEDLLFSFKVCKHVKSNALVYAKNGQTVGIGAGQMSRLDAARIAVNKAAQIAEAEGLEENPIKGSVVASDAFFPFADGLIAAAEAGITAVIQPGGSIRDEEVIEAANERSIAMVFTKMRHFKH